MSTKAEQASVLVALIQARDPHWTERTREDLAARIRQLAVDIYGTDGAAEGVLDVVEKLQASNRAHAAKEAALAEYRRELQIATSTSTHLAYYLRDLRLAELAYAEKSAHTYRTAAGSLRAVAKFARKWPSSDLPTGWPRIADRMRATHITDTGEEIWQASSEAQKYGRVMAELDAALGEFNAAMEDARAV